MHIHDIQAFLAIAQTRNMSRAAENLFITQTAITHRLQNLENELGLTLFERGRGIKEITLTPSGEDFMPIARRWESLTIEMAHFKKAGESLHLSFGSVQLLNDFIFPTLFHQLFLHEPTIHLEIHTEHTTELYPRVDQRMIDIAVVWRNMKYPNIKCIPWKQTPMVLLKSGSPKTAGRILVKNNRLNTKSEIYVPWTPEFKAWHDDHWPSDIFTSPTMLTGSPLLLQLLQDTDRWAIAPLWLAQRAIKSGNFTYALLDEPPKNLTAYIITHKSPRPSTKRALDLLSEYPKDFKI